MKAGKLEESKTRTQEILLRWESAALTRLWAFYASLPPKARTILRRAMPQWLVETALNNYALEMRGFLSGIRMYGLDIGNYLDESHEKEVCNILRTIVHPGYVCVDVGAHKGYFTLILAKLVGERGRVIAFEAHPGNATKLRTNVAINGYEQIVEVENIAVSDRTSDSAILFPGRRRASAEWNIVGTDARGRERQPAMKVRETTLDEYFPQGSCIDLVKIDVEGAEGKVINGMERILENK
jgi:FkbM family methyltransferase